MAVRERVSIFARKHSKIADNMRIGWGDGGKAVDPASFDVEQLWNGSVLLLRPTTDDTGRLDVGDGTKDMDGRHYFGTALNYFGPDVGNAWVYLLRTVAGGDSPRGLNVDVDVLAGTAAFRQGGIFVAVDRASDQALTAWDGNPETGIKIAVNNRANNGASNGAVRGLDISSRNRGTNINWVSGVHVGARNDSGMQAQSIIGVGIRVENYGNVATAIRGLDVELSDENSNVDPHDKYGIRIRNTDASGMGAADAALEVSHSSTNGFSAFAHLATAVGDGAVASVATPTGNTTEALIVKIGANLRYIPCYAAVGFGG